MMDISREKKPAFTISTRKKEGEVIVEIEDNGPGMDEETKTRIFEPFFTTKAVGVGTGLGLYISYFIIVENHKGSINVESFPGKGTRFIIHLPVSV
jgi:polar amino acid transport system substrate-binding protein